MTKEKGAEMGEIRIAFPSYKRPKRVDTWKYLPSAVAYVCESEADAYRKENPGREVVAAPLGIQGNLCRIRNWMLDQAFSQGVEAICLVDDDLQYIGYYEHNKKMKLRGEEEVVAFIAKYTQLAMDLGCYLWGINVNPDKQCYREATPFAITSYIGGPFMVHLRGGNLRFDERLPLKEDYDFTLQHLNRYRRALRVNKFHYETKQAEQPGGCAAYRSVSREVEQLRLLQKKWGSDIVNYDTGQRCHRRVKEKTLDINPVLRVPIKGV